MRQQSMGAIVSALQEGGYVVGSPDPNDGRRTILSLTDMSREKINVSRALREDWLVRVLQENLSAAEQAELAGVVGHLQTLADAEFPVRVRF
jgi:DNA-binding MarR family transcriptional regulator